MIDQAYTQLLSLLLLIGLGGLLYRLPLWQRPAPAAGAELPPLAEQASGEPARGGAADAAHLLGQCVTYVLIPALLFKTVAQQDFTHIPWGAVQAYFTPAVMALLGVYAAFLWQGAETHQAAPSQAARPAVRTTAALYGNAVQLGIPMAYALFGAAGLAIHLALVSLHSLILLVLLTVLAEWSLARAQPADVSPRLAGALWRVAIRAVRRSLWHPVVLPIVAGLLWNALGLELPPSVAASLATLAGAAVPLCLLQIGMNLAHFGWRAQLPAAIPILAFKLLLMPLLVWLSAVYVFGLGGLALQVLVMMAALPVGTNALIFAQRYRLAVPEATTCVVTSTLAFAATAPAWLWALKRWA